MARKKWEEEKGIEGGWINTFADLMNLLLCFFVLLFSMSTVDADKYEQIVTSMSERINIFDGGGNSIGEGAFVTVGTQQPVAISQYFNEFTTSGSSDSSDENSKQTAEQGTQPIDESTEKKVEEKMAAQQKERNDAVYKEVVEAARKSNIEDEITINTDKNNQYVQISLNGGILFDSGSEMLKSSAKNLLNKVGDILKMYDNHMIKIEGHTDDVPISGGRYRSNRWLSTARATEVLEYLVDKKKLKPASLEASGLGEYYPVASNATAKGRAQNRRVELKIYTDNKKDTK